jgi:F-type H+-transporting ATPase subunit b
MYMATVQKEQYTTETTAHGETVSHMSAPADESVAASLGINVQLFAFQLINFAIVLGIVWFLILKPLTKKMEERKVLIDESLDKAKEIETNHIMSQQKYQEKIDEAKIEANKIIEQASVSAEKVAETLKIKAKQEIEMLIEQAKKGIERERVEMRDEIRKETADMIVAALQKVMGEKVSKELDETYIRSLVAKK